MFQYYLTPELESVIGVKAVRTEDKLDPAVQSRDSRHTVDQGGQNVTQSRLALVVTVVGFNSGFDAHSE